MIENGYNWDGTTEGNRIAKSLAATSGWASYSTEGTIGSDMNSNNCTGFTALPGGCRYARNGSFYYAGKYGYWWSSTPEGSEDVRKRNLDYNKGNLYQRNGNRRFGFSVRCVQGN